jgi:SAM-dependent methyltransferase
MSVTSRILEHTFVYRAWQAPFAEQKFLPVLERNDMTRARRVLDVACGPGTNTRHFAHADYLGIDVNPEYIRDAQRKYGREFLVADASKLDSVCKELFDFILVNSFLHHLNTSNVFEVLSSLDERLAPDGHIHVLEPILPEDHSVAEFLARWDRGHFIRPLPEWQSLFSKIFVQVLFEPYTIRAMGTVLWKMVYFKGKRKR